MEHACADTCRVCGLVPVSRGLSGSVRIETRSPIMEAMLKRVARFARTDAPVAVLGETGSGKEMIARVLHANSPRARAPFVAVNVAALPAELLESELFGHGKGAFTGAGAARRGLFEEAHGGTLFLDEIGEMPLALQSKLLRVLQDGEVRRVGENQSFGVNVRIVCATHRDPSEQVRQGLFREDLYFRLKVLTLFVPALRERTEDVLPLAAEILRTQAPNLRGFTARAEVRLVAHTWPGNVRELQNVVKHGAALAQGEAVDSEDLPDDFDAPSGRTSDCPERPMRMCSLAELEREHILHVLDACGGSQSEAARVLGIARNTLWRKLREYAVAS